MSEVNGSNLEETADKMYDELERLYSNRDRFIELISSVKRDGVEDLKKWLWESDFYTAPASRIYHGDYPGGLCEHSLNVYDEMCRLAKAYPEVNASDESIIVTALLHDICKVNFYGVEYRNRKNEDGKWEKYEAYTIREKFKFGGHGSKSMYLAQHFIKLTPEEAVAINCHMGCWDGNKYVGEAYEAYPFAWLLHVADEASTYIKEKKD